MLDDSFPGGSCISHSNLLMHTAQILGVPLTSTNGVLKRVWASCDSNFNTPETITYLSRNYQLVVVLGTREQPENNNFEGCFYYNSKWYPGAVGSIAYTSALNLYRYWAAWPAKILYMTVDAGPVFWLGRDSLRYTNPFDAAQENYFPLP